MWNESEGKEEKKFHVKLRTYSIDFLVFPHEDSFVNDELSFQVVIKSVFGISNRNYSQIIFHC